MRTGVWLVGARGSVATTSIVGALAAAGRARRADRLRHRAARRCAAPALPAFGRPGLRRPRRRHHPAGRRRPRRWPTPGVVPGRLVAALRRRAGRGRRGAAAARRPATRQAETADADRRRPRPTSASGTGWTGWWWSTSPPPSRRRAPHPAHADLDALRRRAGRPGDVLPPSSLYAYAAFAAGCPYVDFTPSTGARLPALAELAAQQRRCRTPGTTARPARRWSSRCSRRCSRCATCRCAPGPGINLLGGGDGATLADPAANAAKSASKQRVLGETLGYVPAGRHPHRLRRRHRRLQDRLGPRHLRRLPRHRACGCSSPGTAATPRSPRRWCWTWPGSPRPRTRAGRTRAADRAGVLLQGPARRRRRTRWPTQWRRCSPRSPAGSTRRRAAPMPSLRDLAELVRAPAALSRARRRGRRRRRRRGARAARTPALAGAVGAACTGRAWPPTTGPTASSTPSSARSGRSRRGRVAPGRRARPSRPG